MPSDIRDALRDAAGRPTKELDMHTVWNRGTRLTWSRRVVAASMVVLVGLGAWASAEAFGDGGLSEATPGPAGIAQTVDPLCAAAEELIADSEPVLSVFLRDDVTLTNRKSLADEIRRLPGVVEVTYVSKREGYKRFADSYKDEPFAEEVGPMQFPATFEVRADDNDHVEGIADAIENQPAVEEVQHPAEMLGRLCNDPETRGILKAYCRNPEDFPQLEDSPGMEFACDLLQSPAP